MACARTKDDGLAVAGLVVSDPTRSLLGTRVGLAKTNRTNDSDRCRTCRLSKVSPRSHGDDDISLVMPFVNISMSLGDLLQRKGLVDDWLQLSRFDQLLEEDQVLDAQHWSA